MRANAIITRKHACLHRPGILHSPENYPPNLPSTLRMLIARSRKNRIDPGDVKNVSVSAARS
jgi:hypothetical protein